MTLKRLVNTFLSLTPSRYMLTEKGTGNDILNDRLKACGTQTVSETVQFVN